MLPPLNDAQNRAFTLSYDVGYEKRWSILTPEKGSYYFSITLGSTEVNRYNVRLQRMYNSDKGGYVQRQVRENNTWEFYPLEDGEYHVVVTYEPTDGVSQFSIDSYSFRSITCFMLVTDADTAVYDTPDGTILQRLNPIAPDADGQIRNFYLHPDFIVNVVGSRSSIGERWYEIMFPEGGRFPPERETTGWVRGSALLRNDDFSPDCRYFDNLDP